MENDLDEVGRRLQLIDISSEDDFLVAYPFRDSLKDLRLSVTMDNIIEHDGFELFKAGNTWEANNKEEIFHTKEQKLSPIESQEPGRASYLRRSLAWDNAFFTSAGVLDPEELSDINKGFMKADCYLFPVIQEDLKMRRSTESESTFDCDAFSLESFEGDLFEDIRASICRSSKMFDSTNASSESILGEAGIENIPCSNSKEVDVGSQNMVKSMSASKRQSIVSQRSKTNKEHNAIKGEFNSSSDRSTRRLGRLNTHSAERTIRASLGNGKTENRTTRTGYGHGLMVSKKSGLEESSSSNFYTPPTKLPPSISLAATKHMIGSSCDKSARTPSKSFSNYLIRKSGSSSSKMTTSGSTSKAPLTYSGRSRSRFSNPTSSVHLLSMSHQSSSKSPASSIDEWSSKSTSSRSGGFKGSLRCGTTQVAYSHPNPSTRKVLRRSGNIPGESTRKSKPSGLRMPSPKIGFFDEENSLVPMVRDSLQFQLGVHNVMPNSNATTIKRRPGKHQPSRNLAGTGKELENKETRALHPFSSTTLQQTSVSKKASATRNSLRPALKAQPEEVDKTYCSKTRKIGNGECDRRKVGLTSSLEIEGKRTKGILTNKMGKAGKFQNAENGSRNEILDPTKKEHEVARQKHVENNLHFIPEKMEKLLNVEDQVNGLSRYFKIVDLNGDVMLELGGKVKNDHEYRSPSLPSFKGEHLLNCKQQDPPDMLNPSPLSLPTNVEFTPSTRTPLVEKNYICNRHRLLGLSMESKAIDKASTFPALNGADKENS